MGYPNVSAREALRQTNNDVNSALQVLWHKNIARLGQQEVFGVAQKLRLNAHEPAPPSEISVELDTFSRMNASTHMIGMQPLLVGVRKLILYIYIYIKYKLRKLKFKHFLGTFKAICIWIFKDWRAEKKAFDISFQTLATLMNFTQRSKAWTKSIQHMPVF